MSMPTLALKLPPLHQWFRTLSPYIRCWPCRAPTHLSVSDMVLSPKHIILLCPDNKTMARKTIILILQMEKVRPNKI